MYVRVLILSGLAATAALALSSSTALSHCEIPCGIYGDKMRVAAIVEHTSTIEKSMKQIQALSGKADAQSVNQMVRWVNNKDEHADKVQHIATQYFMTQRIKPKGTTDAARDKYVTQLTSMHQVVVSAMKCKQTVDPANCQGIRNALKTFNKNYFSAKDLEHLKGHHDH